MLKKNVIGIFWIIFFVPLYEVVAYSSTNYVMTNTSLGQTGRITLSSQNFSITPHSIASNALALDTVHKSGSLNNLIESSSIVVKPNIENLVEKIAVVPSALQLSGEKKMQSIKNDNFTIINGVDLRDKNIEKQNSVRQNSTSQVVRKSLLASVIAGDFNAFFSQLYMIFFSTLPRIFILIIAVGTLMCAGVFLRFARKDVSV